MSNVIGVGIDIAFIPRFLQIFQKYPQRFIQKTLHASEKQQLQDEILSIQAETLKNEKIATFLASKWSAKESVFKALPFLPPSERVAFPEINITKGLDRKPQVILEGKTKDLYNSQGINKIILSISHDRDYCIAQSISLKNF